MNETFLLNKHKNGMEVKVESRSFLGTKQFLYTGARVKKGTKSPRFKIGRDYQLPNLKLEIKGHSPLEQHLTTELGFGMVLHESRDCYDNTLIGIYSNNNSKLNSFELERGIGERNTFFFADDNIAPYNLGILRCSGEFNEDKIKLYDLIDYKLKDVETPGDTPKLVYFNDRFCVKSTLEGRDIMSVKISENFPTEFYKQLIGKKNIPAFFNFRNELVGIDEQYANDVAPGYIELLGKYFKGKFEF